MGGRELGSYLRPRTNPKPKTNPKPNRARLPLTSEDDDAQHVANRELHREGVGRRQGCVGAHQDEKKQAVRQGGTWGIQRDMRSGVADGPAHAFNSRGIRCPCTHTRMHAYARVRVRVPCMPCTARACVLHVHVYCTCMPCTMHAVYHACRVLHVHGRVHARMVRRPQREREYVGRMHPAHSRGYASEGFGRVRDDELVEDEDHGGGEGCEAHERDSPKTMRH